MDERKIILKAEGKRFRSYREQSRLSQKEAAELLGISSRTLGAYERGERDLPLDFFIKLGQFYHVSLDYLAGLTDDKTIKK